MKPWETCIHQQFGLCHDCQAEYDLDEDSWIEYGRHQDVERRYRELLEEIAAGAAQLGASQLPADDSEIPF